MHVLERHVATFSWRAMLERLIQRELPQRVRRDADLQWRGVSWRRRGRSSVSVDERKRKSGSGGREKRTASSGHRASEHEHEHEDESEYEYEYEFNVAPRVSPLQASVRASASRPRLSAWRHAHVIG